MSPFHRDSEALARSVNRSAGGRAPPSVSPAESLNHETMRRWPYILVVDDDADFRSGLRMALEMKGYQVDEAANGEEALAKLIGKPFESQELEKTIANLLRPRLVTVKSAQPEKPR